MFSPQYKRQLHWGTKVAGSKMPPQRARRRRSAPNDVEGYHFLEPRSNNTKASIPKNTMTTMIEAIKELHVNQIGMVAVIKEL